MSWVADFHIHSHFSMATSKESNPQSLARWAGLKGISLLGTGDFTHPGWRQELSEALIPAEPGFYKLKEAPAPEIPGQPETRFVVSGELSTIYKKNGRVRKVHHLIILPSLEAAERISRRLAELGMNIRSDGRPILGLDSHDLFSLVLEECPEVIYVPAHIWTPHFSVFGSKSGFDDIRECYEDLTQYIHVLETGLSSDPPMNWRWSALDRFTLISNSDAHNPQNLGREANLFETEFSYDGIKKALEKKTDGFIGTIEFFPEEGKYHYDGHRHCEVAWKPEETIAKDGICTVCGRKVTVGVLHRVNALADRPEGYRPEGAKHYQSLVPLTEVIGSALHRGKSSLKVIQAYQDLLTKFGPELTILRETELDSIAKAAGPLVAEAIRRLRSGEIVVKAGYDGAYGKVSLLSEADRQALLGQAALFEEKSAPAVKRKATLQQATAKVIGEAKSLLKVSPSDSFHSGLTEEQEKIVKSNHRIISVCAGPGTGKTKTLVERIVYLIRDQGVDPAEVTAVTFTNRAANEIKSRLAKLLAGDRRLNRLNLGTFHSLVWKLLQYDPVCKDMKLLDDISAKSLIEETLREQRIPLRARDASLALTLLKNKYLWEEEPNIPPAAVELYQAYQKNLRRYRRWDFDDLIPKMVELWEEDPDWLKSLKQSFRYLLVDEFQDLNLIQYRLVKLWAQDCRSLMVIGDPNQSIYGFRGSDSRFFNLLQQDFPETVSFKLTQNFRSSATVVKAANSLIPKADRQIEPKRATGQKEPKIIWYETASEKETARVVVEQIIQLLGGSTMISAHGPKRKQGPLLEETFSLSEIAILYRTGRQAESLEIALTAAGLPYRVSGSNLTLEAPSVKEFLTFFRYLTDPGDIFWLRSALQYPRWDLKGKEVAEIIRRLEETQTEETGFWPKASIVSELPPELALKLEQFWGVAEYYREQLGRKNVEVIEDWMIRMDAGLEPELEQLKRISENYGSLADMLRFLPLAQEADLIRRGNRSTGTEMITLSTLHAAKGLEFPVVFICGVEEGLIPYDAEDLETIAEEQRLFYVGMTRAERRLYLVNSQFRLKSGKMVPIEASRFLKLLPSDLLEKAEWTKRNKGRQLELF